MISRDYYVVLCVIFRIRALFVGFVLILAPIMLIMIISATLKVIHYNHQFDAFCTLFINHSLYFLCSSPF